MNGYIYRHIRVDTNEVFYIGSGGFDKSEEGKRTHVSGLHFTYI